MIDTSREVDARSQQHRGDERQQHQPVEQEVPPHRREQRPEVGGHQAALGREVAAGRPQPIDRGEACLIAAHRANLRGIQPAHHLVATVAVQPRCQPAADVAAAGYRGEVIELAEHTGARERLKNSQSEGCAADSAAGEAQRCGPALVNEEMECFEPFPIVGRQTGRFRAVEGLVFRLEDRAPLERARPPGSPQDVS